MRPIRLLTAFALTALLVAATSAPARANPVSTPYGVYASYPAFPAYGYLPGVYAPYFGTFAPVGYVSPYFYWQYAYVPYGFPVPPGFVTPGGAFAPYGFVAPFGMVAPYGFLAPTAPAPVGKPSVPAKITITLPADATLKFNGTAAQGEGGTRAFQTPDLVPGYPYVYEVSATVVRNRQVVHTTERVVVWAGEEAKVTLRLP